jgi:hypothetical protein
MAVNDPAVRLTYLPNARAVRRFWMAWLVLLLTLLAGVIIVILIAAVMADPTPISPAG